jgi:uncharacterized membrane protein YbhN (UPF0104 family)
VSAHPVRRALGIGLRLLLVALVAFGLWLFVRGLDPRALLAALRSASPSLLAAAAVVNLAHLGFRMLRLRELVRPTRLIGTGRLYRYFLALCAGNNLLPARAGEAVRIWLLHSREGVAASTAISASVVEKVSDVVSLLILVAPLPWLLSDLPAWVARSLSFSGLAAAVLIAILAALLHAHRHYPPHTLRGRIALGGRTLHGVAGVLTISLLSFGVWVSDAATLLLVLRAVHVEIPFAGTLFVLLTLNLAIAAPSTPAQVGAFELGTVAALRVLHVPEEPALAVALLYHLAQVIPVTLLGLPDLLLITRARAVARAESAPAAPSARQADT